LKRPAIGGATIAVGITAMVATLITAMVIADPIMATAIDHMGTMAMAGDRASIFMSGLAGAGAISLQERSNCRLKRLSAAEVGNLSHEITSLAAENSTAKLPGPRATGVLVIVTLNICRIAAQKAQLRS